MTKPDATHAPEAGGLEIPLRTPARDRLISGALVLGILVVVLTVGAAVAWKLTRGRASRCPSSPASRYQVLAGRPGRPPTVQCEYHGTLREIDARLW